MCCAMCSASASTSSASPITTFSMASSNNSGKRDMWTPFCDAARSTVQSISAAISFSESPQRSWIVVGTPLTPARERPSCTSGSEACRSCVRSCVKSSMSSQDRSFARLVSLACHDLRTPLATVHGFARTIERTQKLENPLPRYIEMISAAAAQMTELLETLSAVARIEGGRYDPIVADADTLELARVAADRVEGASAEGAGASVTVDAEAAERALAAFASCAVRHGAAPAVTLRVDGK